MTDNFQWTDELVWEFTVDLKRKQTNDPIQTRMELFKISKSKKPLFKTEDGVDIFQGDKHWYVGDDMMKVCFICSADSAVPFGLKTFSTKTAAEDYILRNKPIFSVNDILGNIPIRDEVFTSQINFEKYVMQLAKEKLNK